MKMVLKKEIGGMACVIPPIWSYTKTSNRKQSLTTVTANDRNARS